MSEERSLLYYEAKKVYQTKNYKIEDVPSGVLWRMEFLRDIIQNDLTSIYRNNIFVTKVINHEQKSACLSCDGKLDIDRNTIDKRTADSLEVNKICQYCYTAIEKVIWECVSSLNNFNYKNDLCKFKKTKRNLADEYVEFNNIEGNKKDTETFYKDFDQDENHKKEDCCDAHDDPSKDDYEDYD